MKKFDPTFYLVTDPDLSLGRPEEEIVRRAVAAGVTMVQYRDKNTTTKRMIEKTRLLAELCRPAGAALIVNDRLDVAMAGGANGVHLGQDDMLLPDARRIAGENFIIGISVTTTQEAKEAEEAGADYLGANGVFPTGTKTDLGVPLGLEGVSRLAAASPLPIVAIGGINDRNAGEVISAGADGVAVVSYIVSAENIEERCKTMLEILMSVSEK
ncbi:MAG: thiamine phosphate synthase [bacterium]|nr:thiamine phosphate synthase [bacterium]MDT8366532.1 thiamine phosphate synthase [bacterium]